MKKNRSMIALFVSVFFVPFLLSFMFYMIALSQQEKINWDGFTSTHWAGPYFAVGGIICILAFVISQYWFKADMIVVDDHPGIYEVSASKRISHSVCISEARWEKFQSIGGAKWLDKAIDEA